MPTFLLQTLIMSKEPNRYQLSSRLAYSSHTPAFLQRLQRRVNGEQEDEDEDDEYEAGSGGRPPIPRRPAIPERPEGDAGSADEDDVDEAPQVVVLREGKHLTAREVENERRKGAVLVQRYVVVRSKQCIFQLRVYPLYQTLTSRKMQDQDRQLQLKRSPLRPRSNTRNRFPFRLDQQRNKQRSEESSTARIPGRTRRKKNHQGKRSRKPTRSCCHLTCEAL